MKKIFNEYFKKADIIIFVSIFVISLIPSVILFKNEDLSSKKIVVYQYNKEIATFPINDRESSIFYDFEFEVDSKKYRGKIETKDSKVRLLRLPKEVVPKSIHEDMGWIQNSNRSIIALPASLMILIQGDNGVDNTDSDVDAIAM